MSDQPIRLYFIPGTATDRRIFAAQLERLPGLIIPEWLAPLSLGESLESYAKRLAATIDVSAPFILGGVSLGGMIAQQMTLTIKPLGLILIATCERSKAMSLPARVAGKCIRFTPNVLVRLLLRLMSRKVRESQLAHKLLYAQMLEEMPPRLVRWQGAASTRWNPKETAAVRSFQIHGAKDPLIPIANVKADVVVEEGMHLINATHPDIVNRFIEDSLIKLLAQNDNSGNLSRNYHPQPKT